VPSDIQCQVCPESTLIYAHWARYEGQLTDQLRFNQERSSVYVQGVATAVLWKVTGVRCPDLVLVKARSSPLGIINTVVTITFTLAHPATQSLICSWYLIHILILNLWFRNSYYIVTYSSLSVTYSSTDLLIHTFAHSHRHSLIHAPQSHTLSLIHTLTQPSSQSPFTHWYYFKF